jgi:MFS family permease
MNPTCLSSVGQLFWGPFSDRFGRRLPVALGCLLFIAGSAGCALSTSGTTLIAWRLVQAFGACVNVVLARAMVRDLYEGQRAAQKMSTLMTVMAILNLPGRRRHSPAHCSTDRGFWARHWWPFLLMVRLGPWGGL